MLLLLSDDFLVIVCVYSALSMASMGSDVSDRALMNLKWRVSSIASLLSSPNI